MFLNFIYNTFSFVTLHLLSVLLCIIYLIRYKKDFAHAATFFMQQAYTLLADKCLKIVVL